MIADVFDLRLATQSRILPILQNFIQQMPVLLLLSSGINQTWVCRRILRLEILDRFKIRRVRDDFRELLQLLELIQFRFSLSLFSNSGTHDFFLRMRCLIRAKSVSLPLRPHNLNLVAMVAGVKSPPRML